MPFHLTRDGVMTAIPADSLDRPNAVMSRDEWETIAGRWPLKRLVAIWNALPDVKPVESSRVGRSHSKESGERSNAPRRPRVKPRAKVSRAKLDSGKAPKQPRSMPCSVGRKEQRCTRSRTLPVGSGTVYAASFQRASRNRAGVCARSNARANACTGSRAKPNSAAKRSHVPPPGRGGRVLSASPNRSRGLPIVRFSRTYGQDLRGWEEVTTAVPEYPAPTGPVA
jgi:hypothetical protein